MAQQWMNNIFNNAKKMQSNPMAQNVEKMLNGHDEKRIRADGKKYLQRKRNRRRYDLQQCKETFWYVNITRYAH